MAIQYLALSTMIVLYSLMFLGGYVSAAGLGLTCPEWPLCPNGIMPSEEYLIEWVHRLAAAVTGALVVATMVASYLNRLADLQIKVTSSLATVFVITQITLGALVIDLKLHAVLVAIHLGIGILLFSMVLLTTLFAFRISGMAVVGYAGGGGGGRHGRRGGDGGGGGGDDDDDDDDGGRGGSRSSDGGSRSSSRSSSNDARQVASARLVEGASLRE